MQDGAVRFKEYDDVIQKQKPSQTNNTRFSEYDNVIASKNSSGTSTNPSNVSKPSGINFNQNGNNVFNDTQQPLPAITNPANKNVLGALQPTSNIKALGGGQEHPIQFPENVITGNQNEARPLADIPLTPAAVHVATGKPEFVQRMNNPYAPQINNSDGTFSTHKMASSDNIAYPTIVNINGKLTQLSRKDAYDYAIKNNEYATFNTPKDADKYANGSWKNGDMAGAKYPTSGGIPQPSFPQDPSSPENQNASRLGQILNTIQSFTTNPLQNVMNPIATGEEQIGKGLEALSNYQGANRLGLIPQGKEVQPTNALTMARGAANVLGGTVKTGLGLFPPVMGLNVVQPAVNES